MKAQLTEKYFSNTLNEDEAKLFEELIKNDPEFRDEVEFQENLKQVCKAEDDLQFKKLMASFEEELEPEKKRLTIYRKLYYKIAVAAVLIFALGWLATTISMKRMSNTELYAAYFEPSKNVSFPITRSSSEEDKLTEAFIAYEDRNYATALTLFDQYYTETKDRTVLYYKANVLLATDQPAEALEVLEIVETSSSNLASRAHWYKALAYLKTNRQTEAVKELEILLKNKEDFKKKEAEKLLKELN